MGNFKIANLSETKSSLLTEILDRYQDENIKIVDGYDEAILGIDNESMRIIYSVKKYLEILSLEMEPEEDDETTPYEMALEYFDYNVRGVKADGVPIWCDDDFE